MEGDPLSDGVPSANKENERLTYKEDCALASWRPKRIMYSLSITILY